MHCHYTHNKNQNNDPGMGTNRKDKEAFLPSENYDLKQRLGWMGLG